MNRGRLNIALVVALALFATFALSACGGKDKPKTGPVDTTAKLGPVPTGITGPTTGPKFKHTPQAGRFSGEKRVVVAALDRLAKAVNDDDAAYLCTDGFSAADVTALNKQGKCEEAIKRIFAAYASYKIDVRKVTVNGDKATVTSLLTANQEGKKASVANAFKMRREDGKWKVYIGADVAAGTPSTTAAQ